MVLFRRLLMVVGGVLAACGDGQAQTDPWRQGPSPGQTVAVTPAPTPADSGGWPPLPGTAETLPQPPPLPPSVSGGWPLAAGAPAGLPPYPAGHGDSGEASLEYQDRMPPGWISGGDPVGMRGEVGELLDPRFYPPAGWFGTLDANVILPHIAQNINGTVNGQLMELPTASLKWTVSPVAGVGYRFLNAGELLLSYQSVLASGTDQFPAFGVGGSLHSRLNLNVVRFDWVSLENSFGPNWGMKWRGGLAFSTSYFDNNATSAALDQRTSEYFIVGGTHAGLDLWRALPAPGWSLYGRLEGMFQVGVNSQKESETILGATSVTQNIYIPTVNGYAQQVTPLQIGVEAGVSYSPPSLGNWMRLTAGYCLERWWALGNPIAQINGSDAGFIFQGFVLRAEINY